MSKEKEKSKIVFIAEKIINIDGLYLAGRFMFLLILGSMAMIKWLEISNSIPNVTARAIAYSATFLISIYIVQEGFDLIFGPKKEEKK